MAHRYYPFIKTINIIVNYTILNVSIATAYLIVYKLDAVWISYKKYLPVLLALNLLWLLSANITGLYRRVPNKSFINLPQNIAKTYLMFACLLEFVTVIGIKPYFITGNYLCYALAVLAVLLWMRKTTVQAINKSNHKQSADVCYVVVVGERGTGADLCHYFLMNRDKGYRVSGFFDDEPAQIADKKMYLGTLDNCIDYVITNQIDEIFCAMPVAGLDKVKKLMLNADQHLVRFRVIPEYFMNSDRSLFTQNFDQLPVISVRPEPLERLLNRAVKRLFDIVFSSFVIVFILSWLYPLLALIIKMQSKGPVLFVQWRSGRDNLPFKCYKFRSMQVNDEADKVQATHDDKRITKIGAFIRNTSLDEIPQFFNVMMGQMSVVGPRPHMLTHTEQYARLIDQFMVRHFIKPGITGLAQVKGYRGETKTTDAMIARVITDVWYLENWTFLLDVKIMVLTLLRMRTG